MESTLSERAIRAENLAENSERKRLGLEEELGGNYFNSFYFSFFPY